MSIFAPDPPDGEQVMLRVMDEQVTLNRFTEYSFASDFLTPSDGWSFSVGDDDLPLRQRSALRCGARVGLFINSINITDGFIDSVEVLAGKSTGQRWVINGRDRLSLALDTTADPQLQFKAGATLAEVLKVIFEPFGWAGDDHFITDDEANRNASTGGVRGSKGRKGKKNFGAPLKSYVLHKLKPHNHESVWQFATRVAQRFGLWIWATSDGEQLVVGKPDFTQEPLYQLRRDLAGHGNIKDGSVKWDGTNQPSVIFADGFSGGGEYGKSRIKVYCVNPYFGVDEEGFVLDSVSALLLKTPEATPVIMTTQPFTRRVSTMAARPMYLHDDESKSREQLEAYVRREMSLLLHKSCVANYVVEGHGQIVDGEFTAWSPRTIVDVQDDVAGIHERLFVLGVHYSKSKMSGTDTHLQCIRLNSIQF